MVLTSIFNNILFISWQSVLIVNYIEQKNSQLYIRDRVTLTNIDYKLKKKKLIIKTNSCLQVGLISAGNYLQYKICNSF